jgi:hypothetical protein
MIAEIVPDWVYLAALGFGFLFAVALLFFVTVWTIADVMGRPKRTKDREQ